MSVSYIKAFSKELKELFEKDKFAINTIYIGKYNHKSYLYFDVISNNNDRCIFDFFGDLQKGIELQNINGICSMTSSIEKLISKFNSLIVL